MPSLTYREIDDPRLRGWLIKERVRCGNAGCHCSTGKRHGPYTYLHYPIYDDLEERWRRRKEYVPAHKVADLRRTIRRVKSKIRREHQATRSLLSALGGLC